MPKTIDLAVLSKLAPSIFDNIPGLYLQSCTNKLNLAAFAEDCSFFTNNPHRRFSIRSVYHGEFDAIDLVTDYMQVPEQFALVSQISVGRHEVQLVYFGRKYANVKLKSDEDVWELLQRMRADGGGDVVEIGQFLAEVEANSAGKLKVN
jgi:hypothetical protein